jgi:hypothetical protein
MDAKETRIAFVSDYQGESDYMVVGGPMDRERISVRYLTAEAEAEFAEYRTPQWQVERVASAGCVIRSPSSREPVTPDVLQAVRDRHAENVASIKSLGWTTEHLAAEVDSAIWTPESGYVRLADVSDHAEADEVDTPAPKRSAGMSMGM